MAPGGQMAGLGKMRANRKVLEAQCTSCGKTFNFGEEVYSCQTCSGYHHAACLDASKACRRRAENTPAPPPVVYADPIPAIEPAITGQNIEQRPPAKCPHCGLLNPGSAQWCDCGYDFQTQSIRRAPPPAPPGQVPLQTQVPPADGEQYCSHCGNVIKIEALKCRFCGHALHELAVQEIPVYVIDEINKTANQALTNAIIGIFFCAPVLGPVAISKGNKAIELMDKYPTHFGPRGKAQAARIIGWIDIVLFVLIVIGRVASVGTR